MRAKILNALWFLVIFIQSSRGLKFDSLGNLFEENVNLGKAVQFYIPTVHSDNEKCRAHSRFYLEELKSLRLWATEMFDATAKIPIGILYGSTYNLGNFDQCVEIKVPYRAEEFTGKYCLAKVTLKPPDYTDISHKINYEYDDYRQYFNISAWEKVKAYYEDDTKGSRSELYISYCLPSSCTNEDLKQSLSKLIEEYNITDKFNLTVDVNEKSCQVMEEIHYTTGDIIIISIAVSFVLLVTLATTFDLLRKMEDLEKHKLMNVYHKIIVCFSFRKNLQKLASESKNEDGLDCIAGLKVLSMFCVILGHRTMFAMGGPMINTRFAEKMYTEIENSVVLNGPIVVDTFFVISGFLATYVMINLFEKSTHRINVLLIYLHRFIRLLPMYALVIAFYCTLLIKIGSGPLWQERVGLEVERCTESWWANLLYINNYVNVDRICMIQSWYLSADMHYFFIVPLLVWLLQKKPTAGLVTVLALSFASVVAAFIIIYITDEDPILLVYMKFLKDPVANEMYKSFYIRSHLRPSAYLTGVIFGWMKYKMNVTHYKIPKRVVYVGWILCAFLMPATVYSSFIFYLPQLPFKTIISAVYGSMYHVTFGLCIGWKILAVSSGNGRWIEPILSWKPFIFLSRITYTTFLAHAAIQLYSAGTLRTPEYISAFNGWFNVFADIILAYMAGFFLTIYFEAPIMGLEKILFGRDESSKRNTSENNFAEKENFARNKTVEFVIDVPKFKIISQ